MTTARGPVRVLVADDQAMVRAGFRLLLEGVDGIDVVAEAAGGDEAVARSSPGVDVVLMDIRMPGTDGLEATRRILSVGETAPRVLVLTTFDLDEYVFAALRIGASGFLLKSSPPEHLVHAIRSVAAGDAILDPAVTRRVIQRFAARPGPPPAHLLERLTGRELEVLGRVAQGLSNAEIAAELFISEATVKTHVTRILAKLELRDRVQAAVFAHEWGLRDSGI
jgi:DNA-binding NarL/FixJ family response regulator